MRILIRKIACLLGFRTDYRITATMLINGKLSTSTVTVNVKPWIHYENILEIEDLFKKECNAESGVNLIMIYKIK